MLEASNFFITNIYSGVRKLVGRVHFTLKGTTNVFDNNTIIRLNIIEEISTLSDTLPSNELQLTMDNSQGDFDLLTLSNMPSILASKPELRCELGLVYLANGVETTEWIPMGTFILTHWKNDITNKIVSMTANDSLGLFADIYYTPSTATTRILSELANEILINAGISAEKIRIDPLLAEISVRNFPERIDTRTALQHIGIVGKSAVFQDRFGNIVIESLETMDLKENYISFPSTDRQLFSYPSLGTYPLLGTGGGMRYIDFNDMYEPPDISLEKSIYQLVIKIYDTADPSEPREIIYTNNAIQGNSGISFEMDNPLVNSESLADGIASFYFSESNYNAIYRVNWRQNPILECGDNILIEDSFDFEKQTRIFKQEINYEGYLSGFTESRGGA